MDVEWSNVHRGCFTLTVGTAVSIEYEAGWASAGLYFWEMR